MLEDGDQFVVGELAPVDPAAEVVVLRPDFGLQARQSVDALRVLLVLGRIKVDELQLAPAQGVRCGSAFQQAFGLGEALGVGPEPQVGGVGRLLPLVGVFAAGGGGFPLGQIQRLSPAGARCRSFDR